MKKLCNQIWLLLKLYYNFLYINCQGEHKFTIVVVYNDTIFYFEIN